MLNGRKPPPDFAVAIGNWTVMFLQHFSALACHHRSVPTYDRLISLYAPLEADPGDLSPRGPLSHHLAVVASGAVVALGTTAGAWLASDAVALCPDAFVILLMSTLMTVYSNMVTALPKLTFVAFVQALTGSVRRSVRNFREGGDLRRFCAAQKAHYDIVKQLEATFAPSLCATFFFLALTMVAMAYFSFVNAAGLWGFDPAACRVWLVSQLVLLGAAVKRLAHLTGRVHRLLREAGAAAEEAILVDPGDPDRPLAEQAASLLGRVDGLPVMGFFTVRRGLLLAILGHLLTYLIIMIEFKLGN